MLLVLFLVFGVVFVLLVSVCVVFGVGVVLVLS